MERLLHVGIDVDDKAFHAAAFDQKTGEIMEFSTKPTSNALLKKLRALEKTDYHLKTCYEASYIGYSLHHFLESKGIDNCIVAPSLIPDLPGRHVKTDRIDSKKLATYFAKDLLTSIYIPDKQDEQVRDLIRSRAATVCRWGNIKRCFLSTMRRYGLNYKQEERAKSHWSKSHLIWIKKKIRTMDKEVQLNFELLLNQYNFLKATVDEYDDEIEIIAKRERYQEKKDALCCFRGLGTLSSMSLIAEIGDIRRFGNPRKLTSYAGMDIREYSSGGKEKKFGITTMGNKRIRTIAVEACQLFRTMRVSRRLEAARKGQDEKIVAIAEKCMKRLKKKAYHLLERNKHSNKIKVACAREFLAFIWEALTYLENKERR